MAQVLTPAGESLAMWLDMKQKGNDISIVDDVMFPFYSKQASFSGLGYIATSLQVAVADHLGFDETSFHVGVNLSCCLWCCGGAGDSPCF